MTTMADSLNGYNGMNRNGRRRKSQRQSSGFGSGVGLGIMGGPQDFIDGDEDDGYHSMNDGQYDGRSRNQRGAWNRGMPMSGAQGPGGPYSYKQGFQDQDDFDDSGIEDVLDGYGGNNMPGSFNNGGMGQNFPGASMGMPGMGLSNGTMPGDAFPGRSSYKNRNTPRSKRGPRYDLDSGFNSMDESAEPLFGFNNAQNTFPNQRNFGSRRGSLDSFASADLDAFPSQGMGMGGDYANASRRMNRKGRSNTMAFMGQDDGYQNGNDMQNQGIPIGTGMPGMSRRSQSRQRYPSSAGGGNMNSMMMPGNDQLGFEDDPNLMMGLQGPNLDMGMSPMRRSKSGREYLIPFPNSIALRRSLPAYCSCITDARL